MHKKSQFIIACSLSVAVVGLCYWMIRPTSAAAPGKKMASMPTVSAIEVHTTQWQPHLSLTGNLSAYQGTTIKSETNGRIQKIYFQPGDHVKAGQLLVQLENGTQASQVNYAKAQLALSKLNYDRYKILIKTHAIAQSDYDTAKYTYESNIATVQNYQTALDQTTIRAPFDGVLGLTQLSPGDYLSQGDSIVTLEKLNPLYVEFSVPEKYIGDINKGNTANIISNAFPNTVIKGEIYALDSNVNTTTGSLTVRANVPNDHERLLPGNFVTLTLYYGSSETQLIVPQTAVGYSTQGEYVYRVINQKAVKTPVTLGAQVDQGITVTKGLQEGDEVIYAGTNKIFDGMPVHAVLEPIQQ